MMPTGFNLIDMKSMFDVVQVCRSLLADDFAMAQKSVMQDLLNDQELIEKLPQGKKSTTKGKLLGLLGRRNLLQRILICASLCFNVFYL